METLHRVVNRVIQGAGKKKETPKDQQGIKPLPFELVTIVLVGLLYIYIVCVCVDPVEIKAVQEALVPRSDS